MKFKLIILLSLLLISCAHSTQMEEYGQQMQCVVLEDGSAFCV